MLIELRAVDAISSYNLNASGISYAQQGFVTDEGYIPAWKVDEHLFVDRIMQQAIEDKRKQSKRGSRGS